MKQVSTVCYVQIIGTLGFVCHAYIFFKEANTFLLVFQCSNIISSANSQAEIAHKGEECKAVDTINTTGTRSAACGKLFLLRICCCSAQQSIIPC